jgi:hypothetical protein
MLTGHSSLRRQPKNLHPGHRFADDAANACGIKGPSAGNTIKGTRFDGNAADTCS